jgi:uroporphyrinogen decarboxylase
MRSKKPPSYPKIKRIKALLEGKKPDRPPFTFWHHFHLQDLPGEKHAETTLDFFRRYDLDLLKVMSDFPYPGPGAGGKIEHEEDWEKLVVLGNPYPEQIKALKLIQSELKGEAFFIETIFQPWRVAEKISSKATVRQLLKENPNLLRQALMTIGGSLANHARLAFKTGAAGIFLAVTAADEEIMGIDTYRETVKSSDLLVLSAIPQKEAINVLHVHGSHPHWEELVDLPVAILNYSIRETSVELEWVTSRFPGIIMGGIDEVGVAKANLEAVSKEVQRACQLVPGHRLILSPGCSVPDDISDLALIQIKEAVQKRES